MINASLWEFTMGEYRKAGWPDHDMLIGHGVGCWWHQQEPILCAEKASTS